MRKRPGLLALHPGTLYVGGCRTFSHKPTASINFTRNVPQAELLPCASFNAHEDPASASTPIKGTLGYYETCRRTEAEIWANYLTDPMLMDCAWEKTGGGRGGLGEGARLFWRKRPEDGGGDCKTKVDTWEEALGNGMPKHWDVAIKTDEGKVRFFHKQVIRRKTL